MKGFSNIQSFTFWQRLVRGGIFIYLGWLARTDLYNFFAGCWNLIFFRIGFTRESIQSGLRLGGIASLFFLVYSFLLLWLMFFVLPITSVSQIVPAFLRMLKFGLTFGLNHGAAIFVKDGKAEGSSGEFSKTEAGIAFLDMRSAMALDNFHDQYDRDYAENTEPQKVRQSFWGPKAYHAKIRAVGQGLVFIEKNEKITGAVDLRVQNRTRKEITADTRDGIRVKTSVSASFTLGQPPDILDVCQGSVNNEIFVIEWDKSAPAGTKIIKKLTRELDPGDEKEILEFLHKFIEQPDISSTVTAEKFPYTFDKKRVEEAVYSVTSLNKEEHPSLKRWDDWPQDVVAEKFRVLLSHQPFMDLYAPSGTSNPMGDLRNKLKIAVRNAGVLAYRVIQRLDGGLLQAGDSLAEVDLLFFPPQSLTRWDVLRSRGIKIINAGCGDLEPLNKDIKEKIKESWLEAKRKEENIKRADYKLEATRIINHARIRTQQNLNYHFAKLLEKQEYPREALAILIFQELEAAAANPETRRLLPENTLSLIQGIGQLLLPNHKDSESPEGDPLNPNSGLKP